MSEIKYACGFCGCPLDEHRNPVDIPENYNPNDYPYDACADCQYEYENNEIKERLIREEENKRWEEEYGR